MKTKLLRDAKSTRLCVSTGDLLGKSHEELVLLLIQLRRCQAQLSKTCEQVRLQMEGEEKLIDIEPHKREEHKIKFKELRERLNELEKQYEMQNPLIDTVDNMVKLNNPHSFDDNKMKAASTSVLDQVLLDEDTNQLSSLQQDREMLEKTIEGVKNKVAKIDSDSESTVNLDKLKKQQKMLEGELGKVRGLLSHSAKRLEEKAAENAQIEQDVLNAKKKLKQVLAYEQQDDSSCSQQKAASLEAELAHIEQVIDDLHHRRKELNAAIEGLKISEGKSSSLKGGTRIEVVRARPTGLAGSAPLPGKKKLLNTYFETDLDTLESKDLARNQTKNSGSEGKSDSNPLYENLDTPNTYDQTCNNQMCQFQPSEADELIAQLASEDIIDDQMKQFYGLLGPTASAASQKPTEIKTVRIVKRENERRKIHFANGLSNNGNGKNDFYWGSSSSDVNDVFSGVESIPPPYYYEDDKDDLQQQLEQDLNSLLLKNNDMRECNDGMNCLPGTSTGESSGESFKRTLSLPTGAKKPSYLFDKQQQFKVESFY